MSGSRVAPIMLEMAPKGYRLFKQLFQRSGTSDHGTEYPDDELECITKNSKTAAGTRMSWGGVRSPSHLILDLSSLF